MTITAHARVLRVGLVIDGQLREQRLIPRGSALSVGPAGDLLAPLPRDVSVFTARGGVPVLRITEDVDGRLASGGGPVRLSDLRRDPQVERRGDAWLLPLADSDAGKVVLADGVVVLFQMVPPPPVAAVAPISADFRPRWLEEDDPLFLGGLGTWAAAAGVFTVMAAHSTPTPMGLESLPEAVRKKVFLPAEPAGLVELPRPKPPALTPVAPPEPAPSDLAGDDQPPESEAMRASRIKRNIEDESAFIRFMRTNGESRGNAFDGTDNVLGQFDMGGSDGAPIGRGSQSGTREGTGDHEDARIEGRAASAGNTSITPTEAPTFTLTVEPPEAPPETDAEAIRRAVDSQQGQLRQCFERASKRDPGLSGRVVVELRVAAGRAVDIALVNSTRNADFGECIATKVGSWRFHGVSTGADYIQLPFVFNPR